MSPASTDLRSLSYRSRATRTMNALDLARLLIAAQRFNRAADVTGLLIFRDGQFLQTVEGPSAQVDAVFERIKKDSAHDDVKVLADDAVKFRVFPEWAMMTDGEVGSSQLLKTLKSMRDRPNSGYVVIQREMLQTMIAAIESTD